MINWFINRKREQQVLKLEQLLVERLSAFIPNMKEIRDHSKLMHSHIFPTSATTIQLTHGIDPVYYKSSKKKHRIYYKLKGVELRKINSEEYVQIPILVSCDLISTIEIEHSKDFWKYYDLQSLRVNDLVKTEITTNNEDEVKLRKILKGIDEEQLAKIEVDETFEIELDGKKFYPILNMEDGNYIVLNTKGQVFRLDHDEESEELINNSVKDFLETYSGNKSDI